MKSQVFKYYKKKFYRLYFKFSIFFTWVFADFQMSISFSSTNPIIQTNPTRITRVGFGWTSISSWVELFSWIWIGSIQFRDYRTKTSDWLEPKKRYKIHWEIERIHKCVRAVMLAYYNWPLLFCLGFFFIILVIFYYFIILLLFLIYFILFYLVYFIYFIFVHLNISYIIILFRLFSLLFCLFFYYFIIFNLFYISLFSFLYIYFIFLHLNLSYYFLTDYLIN